MIPLILDIEASGFGKGSYPIEIGLAMPDQQVHSFLIKPEPDWTHWDTEAEEIHGLSREQLQQEGLSIGLVATTLNELLEGQVAYSDGWGFDSSWLSLLFYTANQKQTFRLETLTRILSEKQLELWDHTRKEIMDEWGVQRHRASIDARLLQETFIRTKALQKKAR